MVILLQGVTLVGKINARSALVIIVRVSDNVSLVLKMLEGDADRRRLESRAVRKLKLSYASFARKAEKYRTSTVLRHYRIVLARAQSASLHA